MSDDLRAAVAAEMPRLQDLLADLVRLRSVSAPGYDKGVVRAAAERIAGMLEEMGYQGTQLLEADGGNPAIFAEIPAPEGAPTLLLYAHYDVQPPGPEAEWETEPFEPVVRNGRMHGRGAADDKGGIVMHLGAVAAHGGRPPVGVQIFLEGEEEAGSESLPGILDRYAHLLEPDAIVIGDGGNWAVGVPAFLTSLRGIVGVSFQLRTLKAAVHSGQYGGLYPDALSAMARLLASLLDDEGNVAIPGLVAGEKEGPEISEELAKELTGVLDGVEQIGTGSIPSRLWTRPAISVLALDAPPVAEAINQLVPVARAKVSLRIAPGQDTAAALQALKDHLVANAPWGTTVEFLHEEAGDATTLGTDNHVVDAWTEAFLEGYGVEPVFMGAGGSIPFISTFAALYPDSPIIVIGTSDPTSSYHAPNESQDLGDLERAVLSEAIAFRLLAPAADA
ncbi:MAG TPA: M20/M25/M40 family metallo-hydrolase [Acidimicrobiia bacterium]|jgi:acetylornithine deacetylase/succinyl-diaminopimelate desuccinylase-like protein